MRRECSASNKRSGQGWTPNRSYCTVSQTCRHGILALQMRSAVAPRGQRSGSLQSDATRILAAVQQKPDGYTEGSRCIFVSRIGRVARLFLMGPTPCTVLLSRNPKILERNVTGSCNTCGQVSDLLEIPGMKERNCLACSANFTTFLWLYTEIEKVKRAGQNARDLEYMLAQVVARMRERPPQVEAA